MRFKFKGVTETICLAVCIGFFVLALTPVSAQLAAGNASAPTTAEQDAGLAGNTLAAAGIEEEAEKVEKIEEQQSEETRITVSQYELDLLARAVYSEARGEPFQGQVAIAAVILNRVEDQRFPNTISGVIFQPWAFMAVHDGQFWLTPDETAYAAVREALKGNDPTGGALYYYNPATATNRWIRSRPIITSIGKHVFAL